MEVRIEDGLGISGPVSVSAKPKTVSVRKATNELHEILEPQTSFGRAALLEIAQFSSTKGSQNLESKKTALVENCHTNPEAMLFYILAKKGEIKTSALTPDKLNKINIYGGRTPLYFKMTEAQLVDHTQVLIRSSGAQTRSLNSWLAAITISKGDLPPSTDRLISLAKIIFSREKKRQPLGDIPEMAQAAAAGVCSRSFKAFKECIEPDSGMSTTTSVYGNILKDLAISALPVLEKLPENAEKADVIARIAILKNIGVALANNEFGDLHFCRFRINEAQLVTYLCLKAIEFNFDYQAEVKAAIKECLGKETLQDIAKDVVKNSKLEYLKSVARGIVGESSSEAKTQTLAQVALPTAPATAATDHGGQSISSPPVDVPALSRVDQLLSYLGQYSSSQLTKASATNTQASSGDLRINQRIALIHKMVELVKGRDITDPVFIAFKRMGLIGHSSDSINLAAALRTIRELVFYWGREAGEGCDSESKEAVFNLFKELDKSGSPYDFRRRVHDLFKEAREGNPRELFGRLIETLWAVK